MLPIEPGLAPLIERMGGWFYNSTKLFFFLPNNNNNTVILIKMIWSDDFKCLFKDK